jgi:group II intron reverse transcriptase/maturase
MYVAPTSDGAWLLTEQRKLYERSRTNPGYVFQKLWGLVTSPQNLRVALARVARNKGRRTSGVDGETVRSMLVRQGAGAFVSRLRTDLRSGAFVPSPARRVLIPKHGQPGKFRPLGIPTVTDRVVQAAMKNIMEPIFEADFYPVSFGFRPGKSAHGALEYLRMLLRPKTDASTAEQRLPYLWAVEGDIKGCFDNIDHHALMERVRRRIGDGKVLRLVLAFLKAGVLAEEQFVRTDGGTPQGGILSPLLANIALCAIEERYERYVWPRHTPTPLTDPAAIRSRASHARRFDRSQGKRVFVPVRYADDFILLAATPAGPSSNERAETAAHEETTALGMDLKSNLGLELSTEKTLVTPVTAPLRFLGHHVRVRMHPSRKRLVSAAVIPRDRSHRLRERIKDMFRRSSLLSSLEARLGMLNPVLRGWCNFYRHAWGAKRVFARLDHYVWWTILRWLRKKHPHTPMNVLARRYGWTKPGRGGLRWKDGETRTFECERTRVQYFKLGWLKPPAFATADGEPGAERKPHAGFGEGRAETEPA